MLISSKLTSERVLCAYRERGGFAGTLNLIMGGCMCKASNVVVSREHLQQAIIAAVEENDVQTLADLYQTFLQPEIPYVMPALSLDDSMITIQGFPLNPLSYCFRLGYEEVARYLIETAKCDISRLYLQYRAAGKTPIQILCEYGHLALLRYFLPMHLDRHPDTQEDTIVGLQDQYEEMSIFLDAKQKAVRETVLSKRTSSTSQTSIQKACEYGHIEVVKYLHSYFRTHPPIPPEFDLHLEDDKSGENCALIASRTGHLELIEYLHTDCDADFHKTTKRKESALQLAVYSSGQQKQDKKFLSCVVFLIEVVRVDLLFEYEETLLLCEDAEIQGYLEAKLREAGVVTSKTKVEERYSIGRQRGVQPITASYREFEERARRLGSDFQLKELFKKELESGSIVSSITPISMTPFSMLSRNLTPDQVVSNP